MGSRRWQVVLCEQQGTDDSRLGQISQQVVLSGIERRHGDRYSETQFDEDIPV